MNTRHHLPAALTSRRIQSRDVLGCRSLFQLFVAFSLVLACSFGWRDTAQAQSFAGSSVELKGVTYTYTGSSTDGNGHQVDNYDGPEYSGYGSTVFTGTDYGGVATVSHAWDGNGVSFSGFWVGSYVDAHVDSDISGDYRSYNGHDYVGSTLSIDYTLNGSGSLVYTSNASYYGSSGSFSVYIGTDGTGYISGNESGVVFGGGWYVNTTQDISGDHRTYNGVEYAGYAAATSYSIVNNALVSDYNATYNGISGGWGTFTVHIGTNGSGEIAGSVSGFVYGGTWYVNGETSISGDYRYIGDTQYQGVTATNNYSIVNGVVVNDYYASYSPITGMGGAFSIHIGSDNIGTISGGQTGYILNGTWYVNSWYYINSDTRWYDGVYYQGTWASDSYSLVDGVILHYYTANYNNVDGGGGPFSVYIGPNGMGTISGNVSGIVYNGSWLINYGGTLESAGVSPPSPVFGRYYSFTGGSYYVTYQSDGSTLTSESDSFSADGVASFTISSYNGTTTLSGNDPTIGSFAGHMTPSGWECTTPRTSPSFAPSTVYNPTTPVRWKSGTLNFSGDVTDSYATDDNSFTMTISGNLLSQQSDSNYAASVTVTSPGGNTGTYYCGAGTFSVGGYDLRVTQKNSTYTSHTGPSLGAQTYYVNGRQLNWTDGGDYDDGDGNTSSSDNYSNGSTGDYMGLSTSSNTTNPGISVSLMFSGRSYGGYDFNFNVNNAPEVSTTSRTLTGGPPAFWLGSHGSYGYGAPFGIYYQRVAEDSPYYYSDSNQWLILTGSNGSFNLHSYNSNDYAGYQTFDISFNGQAGVFTFTNYYGVTEIGFAADGEQIEIPAATPPTDLPPAVYASGFSENFVYVGTAQDRDDASQTLAYYVLPTFTSPTLYWSGVRGINLLTIRLSDHAVTLLKPDYSAFAGTYDTQTHLFQVDPANPLPTPIYGVDPLNNNLPWGLQTPPDGLPATAVINGQLWRFTNVDGNGVAHYVGSYPGQTLTLTPNSSRSGLWDVALTDPFGSNDTGGYHNFAFAMTGGTGITSGNSTGTTINPVVIPRQSIAGDIDIFGNVLSLGALQNDPDTAGLTMSFADDLTTSSLSMALARPSSAWTWSHPGSLNSSVLLPAMKLDASHRLGLYNPADTSTPAILLDPAGQSSFKADVSVQGTLRVKARGDLGMGSFTNGPQP